MGVSTDDRGKEGKAKPPAPAPHERTDLFEEFQRPAQPGDKPKPKGLNAAGYKFPPEGPVAMTKENIAKGLTTPAGAPPPAPAPELKDANAMFETYERPDLQDRPRTGPGLRPPAPKSAKEILADYQPPIPQVFTPKRERAAGPEAETPSLEHDAAHLDAEADLAATKGAVMSHSRRHGPTKILTNEDPFRDMPNLGPQRPPEPASKPSERVAALPATGERMAAVPPTIHASTAPPVQPGDGPRIGLIQADYNHDLTTRMAEEAKAAAKHLGSVVTHHVHVAGVYDMPLMAKALAKRPDVDAIVVVGCVIQGETAHDEVIAHECARKLSDLAFETEKPVGFAVSGPRMTKEAAEARVPMARHAVEAAVKQWRTLKALGAARHHGP